MGLSVFNRHEKKYFMQDTINPEFMNHLSRHVEKDAFLKGRDSYAITNIYFDTESDEVIRSSVAKPKYKEKFRLRSYGIPTASSKVYLEIKKKVNGVVNKRRATMTLTDAKRYIDSGIRPDGLSYIDNQVLNEIEYIRLRNKLIPRLYLAYDRVAFFDRNDPSLRITLDKNIRTRRYDLSLDLGDHGDLLLRPDISLLEIKTENHFPQWLSALLSQCKVYPASFSKYGSDYFRTIIDVSTEGGIQPCLSPYLAAQLMPHYPQAI